MIVSKKALIGAAVIPIIIALIIAIPKISPGGEQTSSSQMDVRIHFVNETMKRISFGVTENIGAQRTESLLVNNDGTAIYTLNVEGEKGSQSRFQIGSDELKRVKALIIETGFIQIPKEKFEPRDDASEFIKYTLSVSVNGNAKTIQWVDEQSAKDFAPSLLTNLADIFGKIIRAQTQ
jgi:hypothetical protein